MRDVASVTKINSKYAFYLFMMKQEMPEAPNINRSNVSRHESLH